MSKKKPRVRASRQQRKPYEPPISWQRLDIMLRALRSSRSSGVAINPETLMEIAQALVCLARAHFFAAEGNQRGRPPKATNTWMAAVIVRELMDKHGATSVKAAARAALPDATTAELETLKHTYRMLKRGAGVFAKHRLVVRAALVEQAAARLGSRKSGHK